ncbi:MAG: peptidoglycan DD-metalloendopeptidase family protein [Anaerolineales bacterium]|nr:peptidoglycan DD-metalloendopeptidase family protein [Anaerolineales bacterium]
MKNLLKPVQSPHLFNGISWGATALIVIVSLGFTYFRLRPAAAVAALPGETGPASGAGSVSLPAVPVAAGVDAITRQVSLDIEIPERPRYDVIEYTVGRGDSLLKIAADFDLEPETILWANADTLAGDPHSIRIGQVLRIPPVDGVYYEWQEGDTLESVAEELEADPEQILAWPGNSIDLGNPVVTPGTYVMVPGGQRASVAIYLPNVTTDSAGGAGVSACGGGATGTGFFVWPANNHFLSGNDFWGEHQGIDIAANEGAPVFAADSGVVTMSSLGWNFGYGNVVQIDHGNGFLTVYAHLSVINVGVCQNIYQGQLVGASGNTGNSFGAHLHFEIRIGGARVNPWGYLPPP